MKFLPGELYHVYNRGNNSYPIFYSRDNYHFFLKKIKADIMPLSNILAYCLMPNHFHLLLMPLPLSRESDGKTPHPLARKIGTLQSSYAQAINKQTGRRGSIFQQKAKSKLIGPNGFTCFQYIHQNPIKARLCKSIEDWPYSSFKDYYGSRNGTIPSKELAYQLLKIPREPKEFYQQSLLAIKNDNILALL